jgi:POT family proton-dependent oligopeptide transporter
MALIMVFIVVIFFWMSFHQNGLTLTFFARDYIAKEVGPITNLFFGPWSIISVFGALAGLFVALGKNKTRNERLIGIALFVFGSALAYYYVQSYEPSNAIAPEIFQSFNPLFIVFLTPLVMSIFAWLNKKGIEPSTPKKIGFGMIIAAIAFVLILVSSLNMVSPHTLDGQAVPDSSRVTPYWLINGYLIFTIAELFLSPMGLSFVSKVAPPRFQGLMQGGWLLATAVGNKLLVVGSFFWSRLDLWMLWSIFIVCCLLSAAFMFSMLKKLERVTN